MVDAPLDRLFTDEALLTRLFTDDALLGRIFAAETPLGRLFMHKGLLGELFTAAAALDRSMKHDSRRYIMVALRGSSTFDGIIVFSSADAPLGRLFTDDGLFARIFTVDRLIGLLMGERIGDDQLWRLSAVDAPLFTAGPSLGRRFTTDTPPGRTLMDNAPLDRLFIDEALLARLLMGDALPIRLFTDGFPLERSIKDDSRRYIMEALRVSFTFVGNLLCSAGFLGGSFDSDNRSINCFVDINWLSVLSAVESFGGDGVDGDAGCNGGCNADDDGDDDGDAALSRLTFRTPKIVGSVPAMRTTTCRIGELALASISSARLNTDLESLFSLLVLDLFGDVTGGRFFSGIFFGALRRSTFSRSVGAVVGLWAKFKRSSIDRELHERARSGDIETSDRGALGSTRLCVEVAARIDDSMRTGDEFAERTVGLRGLNAE